MKKIKSIGLLLGVTAISINISSCSTQQYLEAYAPEESGLNVVKITDEANNSVLGITGGGSFFTKNYVASGMGCCKDKGFYWSSMRLLSMSPDGTEIAYLSRINNQQNIMVRKASPTGASTQRTFRSVGDFYWANDDNLYFADFTEGNKSNICATNAHRGSIMRQLTNNNIDDDPILSSDGKMLYFTRYDGTGPSIWSLNLKNSELTSCARGFNPAVIGDKTDELICIRNSTNGNSEIWIVNYVKGQETLLLSDKNRGYTNPVVSPNGEWILVQGNSVSAINKKNNLDIFAVKIDGSSVIQLTYHPASDCSPVWSADGKSIYFISDRANKDNYYNIWKMNFQL